MQEIVSLTSRPPREDETEGRDYYFCSREAFLKAINDSRFVEYTQFGGNYYGTLKRELIAKAEGKPAVIIADRHGAEAIKSFCEAQDIGCYSVYLQISQRKAFQRLKHRDGWRKARIRQHTDRKENLFDWHGYDCILDATQKRWNVAYDFMNFYIAKSYEAELKESEAAR